jgi:GNAT superfamily N-acetyltransferase
VTFRDATAADRSAIARLLEQLGYPADADHIPARLTRIQDSGRGRVLVADNGSRVVGVASAELVTSIAYAEPVLMVTAFVVDGTVRRQGVGRRLLAAIEAFGRERGCNKAVVTSAERRADAHAFYTGLGWAYTGRRFGKGLEG